MNFKEGDVAIGKYSPPSKAKEQAPWLLGTFNLGLIPYHQAPQGKLLPTQTNSFRTEFLGPPVRLCRQGDVLRHYKASPTRAQKMLPIRVAMCVCVFTGEMYTCSFVHSPPPVYSF